MKIAIIGSGAREHEICNVIAGAHSDEYALFCLPGNAGIRSFAQCIDIDETQTDEIVHWCVKNKMDFVIISSEIPLVSGLTDLLREKGIIVFGPSKASSILEYSKAWAKNFFKKYSVPTANYKIFDSFDSAKNYIHTEKFPLVIKVDGPALGKGVSIANTKEEALDFLDQVFHKKILGDSGKKVVIEEFLKGPEVSFFVIADNSAYRFFGSAMDYKRIGENDTGKNTGGMGSIAPSPHMTPELEKEVMEKIIAPTLEGMKKENIPFTGVLFAGLILTKTGPKVLEFNVRLGDPETQVILNILKTDFLELLLSASQDALVAIPKIEFFPKKSISIVYAAKGYPDTFQKDTAICNANIILDSGAHMVQANTYEKNYILYNKGGRSLNIIATGSTYKEAHEKAYKTLKKINWKEGYYRSDIGVNF